MSLFVGTGMFAIRNVYSSVVQRRSLTLAPAVQQFVQEHVARHVASGDAKSTVFALTEDLKGNVDTKDLQALYHFSIASLGARGFPDAAGEVFESMPQSGMKYTRTSYQMYLRALEDNNRGEDIVEVMKRAVDGPELPVDLKGVLDVALAAAAANDEALALDIVDDIKVSVGNEKLPAAVVGSAAGESSNSKVAEAIKSLA